MYCLWPAPRGCSAFSKLGGKAMVTKHSAANYIQRPRRLLAKSSTIPGVATFEPIRDRTLPSQEVPERLWWAMSEALNTDDDPSYNGLGTYPAELRRLYDEQRPSLSRFEPRDVRSGPVEAHARRWQVRAGDVHDSLRLAHIEESATTSFIGPRLQMPIVFYNAGPRDDMVMLGPQHQDPSRLVALARRRVRLTKGWSLSQIAKAEGASDWRVIQSGLRAWAVLEKDLDIRGLSEER